MLLVSSLCDSSFLLNVFEDVFCILLDNYCKVQGNENSIFPWTLFRIDSGLSPDSSLSACSK